jgi:ubiquinone/menaquinone biosynthesis C-methylase UbiE
MSGQPTLRASTDIVGEEGRRIRAEYLRREREIDPQRYAPWQPAAILERAGRLRAAAELLHQTRVFPQPSDACLEIGYGSAGWLPDLLGWGVRETALHGIELDEPRASRARALLPLADLRVGDATNLPWPDGTFKLVVISTVLSSILDDRVRRLVAVEAGRVVASGGAVLWYDLKMNNVSNPHVRCVTRGEVRQLFSGFSAAFRSVTLAPPLARLIAPRSWVAAQALEMIPLFRTHLIASLTKP